jgi:hypothetical protein
MKKTLTIMTIGMGLLLTGCSTEVAAGPADHYTGPATIEKSYRNSSKSGCKVVAKLPNGQFDTLSVGRRTQCTNWPAGKAININDGRLVK